MIVNELARYHVQKALVLIGAVHIIVLVATFVLIGIVAHDKRTSADYREFGRASVDSIRTQQRRMTEKIDRIERNLDEYLGQ